jgi:Mn-dependent DtxR family transcriptional regulator
LGDDLMEENEMKIMKIVNKANNGLISEKDLAEKLKIKCPILRSYIHDLRHKRHIKYSGKTADGHIIELTREGKILVEKI